MILQKASKLFLIQILRSNYIFLLIIQYFNHIYKTSRDNIGLLRPFFMNLFLLLFLSRKAALHIQNNSKGDDGSLRSQLKEKEHYSLLAPSR